MNTETGTKLCVHFDASRFDRTYLKRVTNANSLEKLVDEMHKGQEKVKKETGEPFSFSPREPLKGLKTTMIKQNVITPSEREYLNQTYGQQASSAAPAPSPLSLSSDQISSLSHTLVLDFDTTSNRNAATLFLRKLHLTVSIPSPALILGSVDGFSFADTNESINDHIHQYGPPSLTLTRQTVNDRSAKPIFPYTGLVFFSCSKSDLPQAFTIPSTEQPNKTLTFHRYDPPQEPVCSHCFVAGHKKRNCPSQHIQNKEGNVKDACIACRSFDHAIYNCPVRASHDYKCPLCMLKPHTVRTCPKVTGIYTQLNNVNAAMIDTNPSRRSRWNKTQNVDPQDLSLPPLSSPSPSPSSSSSNQLIPFSPSSSSTSSLLSSSSPSSISIVEHNKMYTAMQNMLQQFEESKRDKEQTNKLLTQHTQTLTKQAYEMAEYARQAEERAQKQDEMIDLIQTINTSTRTSSNGNSECNK